MSSSYFPYQPPPYVLQLSIQNIPISQPSPPSSSATTTAAASTTTIRAHFAANLHAHQHSYTAQYASKTSASSFAALQRAAAAAAAVPAAAAGPGPGPTELPHSAFQRANHSSRATKQGAAARGRAWGAGGGGPRRRTQRDKQKGLSRHRKEGD